MKITKTHLQELQTLVAPLDTEQRRHQYTIGNYPRADRTHDVNKRYRWDLFWAVRAPARIAWLDSLPRDINDAHIDTALRRLIAPLPAIKSV